MKTKSILRSIGVFMTLLVFIALPSSLAAPCQTCCDPVCEVYYGSGTQLFLEVETSYPSDAIIFYISSYSPIPPNVVPTHNGATAIPPTNWCANGTSFSIPWGRTLYIRALAWRSDRGDSGIVDCDQHNPNQ